MEAAMKSPVGRRVAASAETRAWIAVILSLLLAEVGMHELGEITLGWGGALAAVLVAAAALAAWMYGQTRGFAWLAVAPPLLLVAGALVTDALGLQMLQSINLSGLVILGSAGPDHGLLGLGHLLADVAVLTIGGHQLVRWIRLRNTATALGAAAAFTACCGTTAVLLAPAFAALGGALGLAGIHIGDSLVVVAAVLTASVAALGFALAGGRGLPRPPASDSAS